MVNEGRFVEQAVVVSRPKMQPNQHMKTIALFDEKGDPFVTTSDPKLSAMVEELALRPTQELIRYESGNGSELLTTLPINVSATTKGVIYSIQIPDLAIGDVLFVTADFQATNDQTYNALFSTQIILGETAGTVNGTEITEGAGTNITPANHHMQMSRSGSFVVNATSRKFVNLVGWSAGSQSQPGDTLTIDQDYGRLSILRIKVGEGVAGTLPLISDDAASPQTVYSSSKVLSLLEQISENLSDPGAIEAVDQRVSAIENRRSSADAFTSAFVATLARQNVGASIGTVGSGLCFAARARVTKSGSYSKIRFCTGTTAPAGLTDFRVGVWNTFDGTPLATSENASATVTAASTVYEIPLNAPISLEVGQEVFLGLAVMGTTPGTYRGNASFAAINNIEPAVSKSRSNWAGGALSTLTGSYSGILWAELIA